MKKFRIFLACSVVVIAALSFYFDCASQEKELRKAKPYRANIPCGIEADISIPNWYHEGLCLVGNEIWVCNGRGGRIWKFDKVSGEKTGEIEPSGTFTEGMSMAGEGKFWVSDWDTKKIYLASVKDDKLVPEREYSLAPANPAGIVWNGEHIFVITWTRGLGTRYDLLKMDGDGNILEKVKINYIAEPSQLAWDGKRLWISSWFDRRVYRVDVGSYSVNGYFRTQIEKTTGIVWDGDAVWVTGTDAGLRRIRLTDTRVQ